MKILFDKVGHTVKHFCLEEAALLFEGTLEKSAYHRVELQGAIKGDVDISCNRCGCSFVYPLDSNLKLTLSDQVVEDKVDLDIIEFLNAEIDISFILNSEISSLQSDYHYCTECEDNGEIFEMEF